MFTFFTKKADALVGLSCVTLVTTMGYDNLKEIPPQIRQLKGTRHIFPIRTTKVCILTSFPSFLRYESNHRMTSSGPPNRSFTGKNPILLIRCYERITKCSRRNARPDPMLSTVMMILQSSQSGSMFGILSAPIPADVPPVGVSSSIISSVNHSCLELPEHSI